MIWIIFSGALFFSSVSCGSEYLLDFDLLPPYESLTEVYLGQKLHARATATFAEGLTTEGVVIELLPSVGSPSVFAFSKIISCTKGAKLVTGSPPCVGFETFVGTASAEYTDKQYFKTRVVIDIGDVQSNGAGAAEADNQIIIDFEVVYVSIGDKTGGDEYCIYIAEEYDNQNYIWVSGTCLQLQDNAGIEAGEPTFSVVPSNGSIEAGPPREVELTMEIPRSASPISVEAVGLNNMSDGIIVQSMNLKSVGDAYAFAMEDDNITEIGFDTCPLKTAMVLDLGTPINKEVKDNPTNTTSYQLVVVIVIQVENTMLVGNEISLGIGVYIADTEVHVGEIKFLVISGVMEVFSTFTALPSTLLISPGFADGVEVVLTIPRETNHNYTFVISTRTLSAAPNALSILAITPMSHGNNIACDIPSSAVNVNLTESVPSSGVFDSATLSVNISNHGMQPAENTTNDSDQYKFLVYVMMHPIASTDETFSLDIDVNDVGVQSVTVTADTAQAYPTNLNYTFSVENNCDNNTMHVGSTMAFQMTVKTERSVTAGSMSIEFPLSGNTSSSYLEYSGIRVISKGSNVVCVPLGEIPVVLSDRVDGSGQNDRAVATIPLVCNIELVDDPLEDDILIEVKASWKDEQAFLDEDTTGQAEFCIGSSIGDKVWVACQDFDTKAPIDFTTINRIDGVIIQNGAGPSTWPGDLVVEWSPDNVVYFRYSHTLEEISALQTAYAIVPPLVARYARLVNTDGGACTNYEFRHMDVADDIQFFGSSQSRAKMSESIMFVLDGDSTTCMPLPTLDSEDTAKYYWTTIKTPIFGADGLSPFNISITGKGLTCNNKKGPQVTMAMHPKDSSTLQFSGNRKKCKFSEETGGSPISCKYMCECTDSVTCADVSLLMYYNNGSPTDDYDICEVQIIQEEQTKR